LSIVLYVEIKTTTFRLKYAASIQGSYSKNSSTPVAKNY